MDNELLRFARLAIATARRVVPLRLSRHAGPTYPPASLFAALLLKEHLRLTYRAAEDLLGLSDRPRRLAARPADRAGPLDPVVVRPATLEPGSDRGLARRDRGAGRRQAGRTTPGGAGLDRALALACLAPFRAAGRAGPQAAVESVALDGWSGRSPCRSSRSSCSRSGSDRDRRATSATSSRSPARRTPPFRSSGSWPTPATTARPTTASAVSSCAWIA
jgi:hypothetical protein